MSVFTDAMEAADELTAEVMGFVGTTNRGEVKCPREKSSMTPCIARDGGTALADDRTCVGCRADPHALLRDFRETHQGEGEANGTTTGA